MSHAHPTVAAWLREDAHGFRIPSGDWGQELYAELQCLLAMSERGPRWLVRRRAAASEWLIYNVKCAHLLSGTPLSSHADSGLRAARRRLAFWDFWLDLAQGRTSQDAGADRG